MTDQELHEIFRKIAMGINHHGSFLTTFADALIRADAENFQLLKDVSLSLVSKYNLDKE